MTCNHYTSLGIHLPCEYCGQYEEKHQGLMSSIHGPCCKCGQCPDPSETHIGSDECPHIACTGLLSCKFLVNSILTPISITAAALEMDRMWN